MRSTVARASLERPSESIPLVQHLKLLDRLALSVLRHQLIGEHQPDVILVRTEIGELLQRAKRFVEACPLFCIRSAYSRKFCLASLVNPFFALILPSL